MELKEGGEICKGTWNPGILPNTLGTVCFNLLKTGKVMHNLNLFLPDVHTTKTETIDFQLRKISLSLLSHLEVRPDRERTMA